MLIVILFLQACHSNNQKAIQANIPNSISDTLSIEPANNNLLAYEKNLFLDTTFTLLNQFFKVQVRGVEWKYDSLSIYRNDTIVSIDSLYNAGPAGGLDINDFNGDSLPDVKWMSAGNGVKNYPFLFNKNSLAFNRVLDFEKFPEAITVIGQKNIYYSHYSLENSGWVSDLFSIKNYTAIHLGNIHCDDQKIEISKVVNKKKKLMITMASEAGADAETFIADYWKNNFQKFTQ